MGEPERRLPFWARPLFAKGTTLPADTLRTLVLVSLALFFENYDIGLVNAALPQIAEGLAIAGEDTGFMLSAIRLGGLGAFLLIPFADRFGRRRLFLVCLLGMSAGTFATALSQTPFQFAAAQMGARIFLITAQVLAFVIVAEELPAAHRASGISLATLIGGMGFGLGAGLYAAVDVIPYGWRGLYAVGLLPALLLPFFRRSLRETRRFETLESGTGGAAGGPFRAWIEPVAQLARTHPGRVALLAGAGVLGATGGIAFFQYTSYFVQEFRGWSPGQYTLLVFGAGLLGLVGNVIGGRGSDRFGRRRVGFVSWFLAPVFVALFYLGPEWLTVPSWGLGILCVSAAGIVFRAFTTELFPTSHRASATGLQICVESIGWSLGLALVGILATSKSELPATIATIASATALAALFLLRLPETQGRELDRI